MLPHHHEKHLSFLLGGRHHDENETKKSEGTHFSAEPQTHHLVKVLQIKLYPENYSINGANKKNITLFMNLQNLVQR